MTTGRLTFAGKDFMSLDLNLMGVKISSVLPGRLIPIHLAVLIIRHFDVSSIVLWPSRVLCMSMGILGLFFPISVRMQLEFFWRLH
jgi:hypothetical protein